MIDWLTLLVSGRSSIKKRCTRLCQASLPDLLLCQCKCVKCVPFYYSSFLGPYLLYPTYFTPLIFLRQVLKEPKRQEKQRQTWSARIPSYLKEEDSVRGQGCLRRTLQTISWNETIASKLLANEMSTSFFRVIPKQVKTNIFLSMWAVFRVPFRALQSTKAS